MPTQYATQIDLDTLFTYHAPTEDQVVRYNLLREKAKEFAQLICDSCPPSSDTTAAIRLLRESLMTANAAIACIESLWNSQTRSRPNA